MSTIDEEKLGEYMGRMVGHMKIIGSFVSPYVRKVLVCLELKGLDYEVDPITPFYGND